MGPQLLELTPKKGSGGCKAILPLAHEFGIAIHELACFERFIIEGTPYANHKD